MHAKDVLRRYVEENLPEFVELALTDVNQRGNFGNTPLHVASVRGSLEEVEALLIAGAEFNSKGEHGGTPLHDAAGQGHVEIVKQLLAAGASPDLANDDGNTPRDVAVLLDHDSVVAVIDDWGKSGRRS